MLISYFFLLLEKDIKQTINDVKIVTLVCSFVCGHVTLPLLTHDNDEQVSSLY